ncbi:hypothetical protein Ancab_022213 [Ancistrocladus abbreviatus]
MRVHSVMFTHGPRFRAETSQTAKYVAEMWMVETEFAFAELETTVAHRLQSLISADFMKISYREAVVVLKKVTEKNFKSKIEWGLPLTEEHENYLADEIYKVPVIVYNYPKEVKPFYVRLNDDGRTVAAFNVIIPKVGALIRGSQNEERMNMVTNRVKELDLPSEKYEWYLDLRRHGSVRHAGFSLGIDFMVLLATEITDVRNVIPFPRTYGKISN